MRGTLTVLWRTFTVAFMVLLSSCVPVWVLAVTPLGREGLCPSLHGGPNGAQLNITI